MKKATLVITCILVCISFFSKAQDRQDEVRQKLQLSIDAQSNVLSHVTGWSKIENTEGKFWKQSDLNSSKSYLPCCPDDGFQSLQTFKFTLEGETFYLLSVIYGTSNQRVFAFKSSSLQELQNVINNADGKSYYALPIEYCDYLTKPEEVNSFEPETFVKDRKSMIRLLLTGASEYLNDNWCKGCNIFTIKSQILNGEKIIRFDVLPWKNSSIGPTDHGFTPIENDYFELKETDFEKIFNFSPYKLSSSLLENYYSLNSAKYTGEYKNNFANGQGTCTWLDGTKYVGEFKDGSVSGHGTRTYINGDFEVGEFKNGLLNGTATRTDHDGSIFIGVYENNYMCGQGKYNFTNGNKYEGEFLNSNYNGQGTFTIASGDKYVGEWKNGQKNGQGTFTWVNGDKYVGEWKNNNINGQGTFSFSNGNIYVGEWKNWKKNGYGTWTWVNGDKYVGDYLNDQFNGQGTFTWVIGDKYVGEWKNGQKNGQGTYTSANGQKYVGKFKDDKYIGKTN
jgi:hypothetical protein